MSIELNTIYNEDCLETMKRMPDGFVDCVVTSPPYDKLRKYNGYTFDFESVAKELLRVVKEGGVVVWVVGDATIKGSETGTSFRQALFFKEIGFNLHDTMIYQKINYIPLTHNRYEQSFEYMFVFSKRSPKSFNPIKIPTKLGGQTYNPKRPRDYDGNSIRHNRSEILTYKMKKTKGNVFAYVVGAGNDRTNHPATFPEQLANDHIISWTNKGDLVYDPFMGSGTTAKMCILNGRNYIGSEISSEYCEIAEKRLKQEYLF